MSEPNNLNTLILLGAIAVFIINLLVIFSGDDE